MPPVDPDDRAAALALATRMLANHDRSRVELSRRLTAAGYSADSAGFAVDECAEHGWVDDRRLAEAVVERRLGRSYGPRRMVSELMARGVPAETARQAASAAGDATAAALTAATRLRSRFGPGPLDERDARRLAGALQRRGFDAPEIRAALAQTSAGRPTVV